MAFRDGDGPLPLVDIRGWGQNDDELNHILCDQVYVLNKGTQAMQLRHDGRGQSSVVYSGRYRSLVLVEELPSDQDRVN